MNKWYIIFLLLLGVVLVVGSILLRVAFNGKYEIKAIDLVFILIPLLLVGVATGKILQAESMGFAVAIKHVTALLQGDPPPARTRPTKSIEEVLSEGSPSGVDTTRVTANQAGIEHPGSMVCSNSTRDQPSA